MESEFLAVLLHAVLFFSGDVCSELHDSSAAELMVAVGEEREVLAVSAAAEPTAQLTLLCHQWASTPLPSVHRDGPSVS